MSRKSTLALLVAALGLFAFIALYERHTLSSASVQDRENQLVPRLVRDEVTAVDISKGEARIELRRAAAEDAEEGEEPTWSLSAPVRSPADEGAVASLLGTVQYAEPIRRLEDVSSEDLRLFGLEAPRLRVRFQVANEETTLSFGGEDPTGAGIYARLGDGSAAFVVGRDVFEAFDHDADHFRSKALFSGDLARPEHLKIAGPNGSFEVERVGDAYEVRSPFVLRALESQVEAAVDALRDLEATRFIPEDADGAAANGFETPYLAVTLSGEGEGAHRLVVGAPCEAASTDAPPSERHARVDDGSVVCVADSALMPLLVAPAALRDLRPVTSRDHEVKGLLLERGGDKLEVREDDDDDDLAFVMRRGGKETTGEADTEAFHDLLRAMRQSQATEVIPLDDAAEARFGLSSPRAVLRIERRGEDAGEERLAVGAITPAGLYVRRGVEPVALLLDPAADALFEVASYRLRGLELVDEEPSRLASIAIEGPSGASRVEVHDGQWRVVEPTSVDADASRSADLARRLASLEADRFVADAAGPEHGLDAPRFTVRARFEGAAGTESEAESDGHDHGDHAADEPSEPREHTLRIGASASGGAYATLDDDPAVFVLPASVVTLVEGRLADRRALATSQLQIAAVRIEREGGTIAIRREGDRFVSDAGPSDAERTRALLDRLSSLRATEVMGYGPPTAAHGLAPARARVVVTRTADAPEPREYTLLIGATQGEGDERQVFVAREGLEVTYQVAAEVIDAVLAFTP
jgi:hypothetical protein